MLVPRDERLIVVTGQWTFGCRAGADGHDGCLVPRVGWLVVESRKGRSCVIRQDGANVSGRDG